MKNKQQPQREWEGLIDLMIDGEPTREEVTRLEELLRTSPEARRDYQITMQLVASLESAAFTAESAEMVPGLPSPIAAQPEQRGKVRNLGWLVKPMPAALVACFAGVIGFFLGQLYLSGKPAPPDTPGLLAAEIGRLDQVQWEDKEWAGGEPLQAGDKIEISGGRAELVFAGGVHGVLSGPGRLTVTSKTSCQLFHGTFHVTSPPGSRFFLVGTPAGAVTGMRADYGVHCHADATEVHVFGGTASLDAAKTETLDSTQDTNIEIAAGKAMRFKGDDARPIAADKALFVTAGSLSIHSGTVALQDKFSNAVLNKKWWTTYLPEYATVDTTDEGIILRNRGYLITKKEFHPLADGGLRITGIWQFLNADSNAGNGGVDSFHVLTRCHPKEGEYYRQAAAGIDFHLHSRDFRPRIEAIGGEVKLTGARVEGALEIDVRKPFAFEVIDDGRLLSLTLWDPDNPANRCSATAEFVSGEATRHHVVFYNRERYAHNTPEHSSRLGDVKIFIGQGPAWLSSRHLAESKSDENSLK